MRVILTRHAKAGNRSAWVGDDFQRPLSGKGLKQADEIAEQLENLQVDRIYSSPAVRCVQTVEPLALRLGYEVELRDELAEGSGARPIIEMLRPLDSDSVVLCTHGDIIFGLIGEGMAKGATRVLEFDGSSLNKIEYLEAP